MATIGKVWVEVYYARGDEAIDAIDSINSDSANIAGIVDESIGMTRFTDEERILYYLRLSDVPVKHAGVFDITHGIYTVAGSDGMPLYAISSGDCQISILKHFDLMIDV